MKNLKSLLLGLAMLALGAPAADAATVQIQFGGVNVTYDEATGLFCDSAGCSVSSADTLITASYLLDGVHQGTEVTNIALSVGVLLPAGTSPTVNATTSLTPNFGVFDFQRTGTPGLFTNVATGSVAFSNLGVNATGTGFSSIFSQGVLPFGIPPAVNPINWSFSSGLGTCTGATGSRICTFSGTGELSWDTGVIPEPASMLLFGTGLAGVGIAARVRRRRKTTKV
jgi:hypothetical protein